MHRSIHVVIVVLFVLIITKSISCYHYNLNQTIRLMQQIDRLFNDIIEQSRINGEGIETFIDKFED